MSAASENADVLADIIRTARRVAVVGASGSEGKPAHDTPLRLRQHGYTILPVNPRLDGWEGGPAYKSLADVPKPIDVVNVFRPAEEAPGIARDAVAAGAKVLWLQQEIVSPEARRIAEAAGLTYVEDECMHEEWKRLNKR